MSASKPSPGSRSCSPPASATGGSHPGRGCTLGAGRRCEVTKVVLKAQSRFKSVMAVNGVNCDDVHDPAFPAHWVRRL